MKLFIKFLSIAGILGLVHAEVIPNDKSVVVMPLRYSYQLTRDFYDAYQQSESSLKGYARENASSSHKERYHDGEISQSDSASSRRKLDANYDLNAKSSSESHTSNDRVIIEKHLNTEKLTGIVESALSQAGVKLGMRHPEYLNYKTPEEAAKQALKDKSGDYVLTGDISSMYIGGFRRVPDGTNRRVAINASCKINIKLTQGSNGVSTFARTFTGKASKTFDGSESIPSQEVIDMAIEDIATQLAAELSGKKIPHPSEGDDEYQDSPGKRLVN